MKNNITELVFILDRSGSMSGLEKDTIGGFNAMINKQKNLDGKCYVSTVLFDNQSSVLHDRVLLENIKPMTEKDYQVQGCTALLDALGDTIKHIETIHKYAREEDVPGNTMFVITTDGMENASHMYGSDEVKEMIKSKMEEYGWEFIFVAANIDAVETAKSYGISSNRAVNYHADSQGVECMYATVADAVCNIRQNRPIKDNWSEKLKNDFINRRKGKKSDE